MKTNERRKARKFFSTFSDIKLHYDFISYDNKELTIDCVAIILMSG
jgi:hypothetical protein